MVLRSSFHSEPTNVPVFGHFYHTTKHKSLPLVLSGLRLPKELEECGILKEGIDGEKRTTRFSLKNSQKTSQIKTKRKVRMNVGGVGTNSQRFMTLMIVKEKEPT